MIIKTEDIRNNFYNGAIYKNRPDETCYEHAIDSEIRSWLEVSIRKYQKTEKTISFYGHDFQKSQIQSILCAQMWLKFFKILPTFGVLNEPFLKVIKVHARFAMISMTLFLDLAQIPLGDLDALIGLNFLLLIHLFFTMITMVKLMRMEMENFKGVKSRNVIVVF